MRMGRRFMRSGWRWQLAAALAIALGCTAGDQYLRVGQARLPEADLARPAGAGTLVELPAAGAPLTLPAQLRGPVRLAADRDLPFGAVVDAVAAVQRAGGEPLLLVTSRRKVAALPASDPRPAESIRLVANADARACVSPPEVEEAKCVRRADGKHVERAFVRELVREAVKGYDLTHVHVEVAPTLSWADALRAIDGARTCCPGVTMTVSTEGL